MNKLYFTLLLTIAGMMTVSAQTGGEGTYKFLTVASTARMSAMGDHVISIRDGDVNMALENPALLNEEMYKAVSFSHKFLLAGISTGYVAYGFKLQRWNLPLHVGIKYINYGDTDLTDIYGDKYGTVNGSEYALVAGTSYRLYDRVNLGVNIKYIFSSLAMYSSQGFAMDLGMTYDIHEKNMIAGFVIKNIGGQLSTYAGMREKLPLNVMAGISKKLEHLPFRLSVTMHHLNRWNLLYDDPYGENNSFITGEEQEDSDLSLFIDNLFRHINFGGEFLLGKGESKPLRFRMGYNYMKSKEMSVQPYRTFAGFSFGFGFSIKKINFDYAYSIYHFAGGSSHLSISTNLSRFGKRL